MTATVKLLATRFLRLDAFKGARRPGSFWIDSLQNDDRQVVFWFCCPCQFCCSFGLLPLDVPEEPGAIGRSPQLLSWNGDFSHPTIATKFRSPCDRTLRLSDGEWHL